MNWLARTIQLLGREKINRLHYARVAVFGLGGVGSYAVEALARSGVGHIRLVDFDKVKLTNINRQVYALHSTLDKPKVQIAAERIKDINPSCDVDSRNVFINNQSLEGLLDPLVDVVVDAIDSVSSKANLIAAAYEKKITVVSSMGAGNKTDSSFIRAGDISESTICPLARMIRKRIHRRGIYNGVRCVYSIEQLQNSEPAADDEKDDDPQLGRPRAPLGTISYMPGIFGLKVAEEVIRLILAGGKV